MLGLENGCREHFHSSTSNTVELNNVIHVVVMILGAGCWMTRWMMLDSFERNLIPQHVEFNNVIHFWSPLEWCWMSWCWTALNEFDSTTCWSQQGYTCLATLGMMLDVMVDDVRRLSTKCTEFPAQHVEFNNVIQAWSPLNLCCLSWWMMLDGFQRNVPSSTTCWIKKC